MFYGDGSGGAFGKRWGFGKLGTNWKANCIRMFVHILHGILASVFRAAVTVYENTLIVLVTGRVKQVKKEETQKVFWRYREQWGNGLEHSGDCCTLWHFPLLSICTMNGCVFYQLSSSCFSLFSLLIFLGKKNGDKDIVSAAIMAKVLQERENERKENRRNNCHCRYRVALPTVEQSSQTLPSCTISYSEFEFYNDEEPAEDGEEIGEDEEDEVPDVKSMDRGAQPPPMRPHTLRTTVISPNTATMSQYHQGAPPIPARRPNTWTVSGSGRLPGGAVPVRTTLHTTFDEIIKTTLEEEARLPTPLFGGHLRHRNQNSTNQASPLSFTARAAQQQQHNQHYDNQQYSEHHHHTHQSLSSASSSAMSPSGSEPYNNHLLHHHPHHPHHLLYHPMQNSNGDYTSHSVSSSAAFASQSVASHNNNSSSDTSNSVITAASSISSSNAANNGLANSYRDTPPPPSSLQRSSSSSLSSPSSGVPPPPLSIPTSAAITTDLNNGDMMMLMSSSSSSCNANSSSHVMSSACNTPSSCSNASTSGIGGSSSCSGLAGIFHEPLPMPLLQQPQHQQPHSSSSSSNRTLSNNFTATTTSVGSSSGSSSSSNNIQTTMTNNVVTVRKGARLSTSHISNVCANGSITSVTTFSGSSIAGANGVGPMLTRSTSWNRDKVEGLGTANSGTHGSSSSIGSSTSSGTGGGGGGAAGGAGGGLGLVTSLGNHWRSTVLVHNPPRSHSSYEPLSLISVQGDGVGGQQTTFSAAVSPKAVAAAAASSNSSLAPSGVIDLSHVASGTGSETGAALAVGAAASTHSNNDYSIDCNSDSEQPLLQQHEHPNHSHHQLVQQPSQYHSQYNTGSGGGGNSQQPNTYLFNAYHSNPQKGLNASATAASAAATGNNGFFGSVISANVAGSGSNVGYTATCTTSSNTVASNPSSQYYRAQKRTFWARSSSTTSTETEI